MMLPVSSDVAQGVLVWLGAATVKVSAVLVMAFAATRKRTTSAATRHAIWAAAVVTAVAIPLAQLTLPAWKVAVLPAVRNTELLAALAPLPELEPIVSSNDAVPSAAASAFSTAAELTPSIARDPLAASPVPVDEVKWTVDSEASIADVRSVASTDRSPLAWPVFALSIWLLGAAIVITPWALGVRRRTNLWRRAGPDPDHDWSNAWRYIPTSVNRVIRVRTSDLTTVPMTWGVFAPVILTPQARQWSAAERRAALLHELAHIARFDTVWQGISRLMLVFFWFNPLAWIANAMLRAESERACDDAVLRAGTRASEYAQQLLEVLRSGGERGIHAVAAMSMARRSGMAERLRALLDTRQQRGRLPRRVRLSLVALSGVVAIPVARLTPVPVHAAVPPTSVIIAVPQSDLVPAMTQTADVAGSGKAAASERNLVPASPASPALDGLAVGAVDRAPTQREDCLNLRRASTSSLNSELHLGRLKTTHVKWSTDDCRVTFDLEGEVTFNEDASDVVGLSRGGSLELAVKDGSHTRRVQLDEKNGAIERQYWVDGDRKAWDADAAAWFASALVSLDRRTAFAVDQRLPLLLKKGGVEAALSEIELMYSDYAQRLYYTKLFKLQPLSSTQIRRVLAHVGSSLSSDYERAELLLAIAKLDVFREEAYVDFANAASGIKSAYEKRRALSALLAESNLKPAAVKALLEAAQGMDSDYELAELLVGVAKQYAISDDTRPLYLAALGSLSSDYEHRRVLDTIVKGGGLTAEVTRTLIRAATRIGSDYELAEFLVHVAGTGTVNASNAEEFFAAHATIEGDYEAHRVLTALINNGRTERDILLRVLNASNKLGSDYERASLLVEVAAVAKMDDTLRAAYEKAAEGVKSEYEYGRAMSAIRRSTKSF